MSNRNDASNRFEEIWYHQLEYNTNVAKSIPDLGKLSDKEKKELRNYYSLCLSREVMDALSERDWKIHRDEGSTKLFGRNHLMELVDVFKYWMCLCQLDGYTPSDIYSAYYDKSHVVENNYRQEFITKFRSLNNIAGIDIDGVLCEYPDDFISFANETLGKNLPLKPLDSDLGSYLGLSRKEYLDLKHLYRLSGRKRTLKVKDGAKEFLLELKKNGYSIVLLTARPCDKYADVYVDTVEWLRLNEIPYDAIIYGEAKEEKLLKEFDDLNRISFFLDDEFSNSKRVASIGCESYWMRSDHSESDLSNCGERGIRPVRCFSEVLVDLGIQVDKNRKYSRSEIDDLVSSRSPEEILVIMNEALELMQQYNGRTKVQCIAMAMGLNLEGGDEDDRGL
jgi:uncharacterized HAD superfamily protein